MSSNDACRLLGRPASPAPRRTSRGPRWSVREPRRPPPPPRGPNSARHAARSAPLTMLLPSASPVALFVPTPTSALPRQEVLAVDVAVVVEVGVGRRRAIEQLDAARSAWSWRAAASLTVGKHDLVRRVRGRVGERDRRRFGQPLGRQIEGSRGDQRPGFARALTVLEAGDRGVGAVDFVGRRIAVDVVVGGGDLQARDDLRSCCGRDDEAAVVLAEVEVLALQTVVVSASMASTESPALRMSVPVPSDDE